jgi:uncharacterized membrane protein
MAYKPGALRAMAGRLTTKKRPAVDRTCRRALLVLLAFAALGALSAGTSTYDFIAHVDRQVHAITCSYLPGIGSPDAAGTSGCFAVMMSPYASLLRSTTWGGIPIALLGLGVFCYLLFKTLETLLRRRADLRLETRYLVAATALPLCTSIVYFIISATVVGVVCKLCVGIYVASIGSFAAALQAYRRSQGSAPQAPARPLGYGRYGFYFAEGVLFVLVPLLVYLALKPAVAPGGQCGSLIKPQDSYQVRIRLGAASGAAPAIEVLDPLCPACKALHERLAASGLASRLALEGTLFPLDKECNWMLSESLHPGACAASEALLCAGDQATEVLDWLFAHQQELRVAAEKGGGDAIYPRLEQTFPALRNCVNRPPVKARLNKALRWAVANSLPLLTPQLYIGGTKICDEDTDLGLEYTLTRLLGGRFAATGSSAASNR